MQLEVIDSEYCEILGQKSAAKADNDMAVSIE